MNFHVLTLFPEMVENGLKTSITGRAMDAGLISIDATNIRDFSEDKHQRVDAAPYGGGNGMLMQADPIYKCYEHVCEEACSKPFVIYMSPQGAVLNQKMAVDFAENYEHLLLICGHYEGIDARVINEICDEEISIGDYVLTGGETAAIVVIDAVARLIPGVLPNEEAYTNESHTDGMLEAPQYTKPPVWHDKEVPEVLKNGNDAVIADYNRIAALVDTWHNRPDMLDKLNISESDWAKMLAFERITNNLTLR